MYVCASSASVNVSVVLKEGGSKMKYTQAAVRVANLVREKNLAYGDSFGKSGAVMKLLYPSGVSLDQMDDFLTMTRVLDKMFRIANQKDAFGENPWQDIMGYALLAITKDVDRENKKSDTVKHDKNTNTKHRCFGSCGKLCVCSQ